MTDLATLPELKNWLKATSQTFTDADDTFLRKLIQRVSSIIMDYVSMSDVVQRSVNETRNGTGSNGIMLREWPVLSVSSLISSGVNVPAGQTTQDSGFVLAPRSTRGAGQPQMLMTRGFGFPVGLANIVVEYVAGYVIDGERQTISDTYTAIASQPAGTWARAEAVVFASSGVALVEVPSAPAAGQYAIDPDVPGKYLFNSIDEGEDVLLTYSYVPSALTQACVEWVSERYSYRTRVGQLSRSQGGQETTSFSLKDMPDFIKLALQPFVKVTPC